MVTSKDLNFQKVQAFHRVMDGQVATFPSPFPLEELLHRLDFKLEEIVESLAVTAKTEGDFENGLSHLHKVLDKAADKARSKGQTDDCMVGQVDALLDLLYLTYGSFVLMGVDPAPIFDIVHAANMGKIWPDGRARHDPVTNKILKPSNWEKDYAPETKIQAELAGQVTERKVDKK